MKLKKKLLFAILIKLFWDILETSQCFDIRYCAQNVTGTNGYALLPKPIAKKSHNKNIQQRLIWFYYYFTKVSRSLWCHRIDCYLFIYLLLFIKYRKKISASSYLNISFGWRYISLALKRRDQNKPNNPRVRDTTVFCFKQY